MTGGLDVDLWHLTTEQRVAYDQAEKASKAAADAIAHEKRKKEEAALAAGGFIHQFIVKDKVAGTDWDKDNTITFNVQIMNVAKFENLLGLQAPKTPVSDKAYIHFHYPFFDFYKEKSVQENVGERT